MEIDAAGALWVFFQPDSAAPRGRRCESLSRLPLLALLLSLGRACGAMLRTLPRPLGSTPGGYACQ